MKGLSVFLSGLIVFWNPKNPPLPFVSELSMQSGLVRKLIALLRAESISLTVDDFLLPIIY